MNISEEKQYIYQLMREITEERRKLTEIYFDLKERLNELNKLETVGLEKLSISGYVDLYNQYQKELAVTNIKRETENIINEIQKEEEKEIIPKKEIEIAKTPKKDVIKKSKYLNVNKVVGVIAHVLKESGVPLSVQDLHEKVQNEIGMEINRNNFRNNILRRAVENNKNIQRVMRGYYQYNMRSE